MSDLFCASPFYIPAIVLVSAVLLDFAIGDPRWLPHPMRVIGFFINMLELFFRKYFKTPKGEKVAGVLLVIMTVVPVFLIVLMLCNLVISVPARPVSHVFGMIFLIYLASTTIAFRELIDSARNVVNSLKESSIETARCRLSMIVGRDTKHLEQKGILKATMETLAENMSDGIIAPIFYLTIGGLPGAMAYKAINTLDSMVGYRNDKYIKFGWAAAKLDDIANYIPARITGLLIVVVSFFVSRSLFTVHCSLKTMLRDGRNHLSPNSGIPEAAMAGALGVRFGGPSTYGGVLIDKPYIGEERHTSDIFYLDASEKAIKIIRIASFVGSGVACAILYMRAAL